MAPPAGCFGREEAAKALARTLAEAVLTAGGENRVAFCAFGEAGSSRWSCPLTESLADVLACIDASPVQRGGDHAAGLARALRLLNRRTVSERLGRRAAVVVLSGGETFPAENGTRCAVPCRGAQRHHGRRNACGIWGCAFAGGTARLRCGSDCRGPLGRREHVAFGALLPMQARALPLRKLKTAEAVKLQPFSKSNWPEMSAFRRQRRHLCS